MLILMVKFKVGDKVRIISDSLKGVAPHLMPLGTMGTVLSIHTDINNMHAYEVEFKDSAMTMYEAELENESELELENIPEIPIESADSLILHQWLRT